MRATQLVVWLSASLIYAHAGERYAARILERPDGPPTEDGDYAAGTLGAAAPSLTAPHSAKTSYGAPPVDPCPQLACVTTEKLKRAEQKPQQEADPLQVRNPS